MYKRMSSSQLSNSRELCIYHKEKSYLAANAQQLAEQIGHVAGVLRKNEHDISGLETRHVRIATDEWNYSYSNSIYGELAEL